MKLIKAILPAFFLFAFYSPAETLIITSSRLAYVDIEKVYENLIMVDNARAALENLIEERRAEVEELQNNIDELRAAIEFPDEKEIVPEDETEEPRDLLESGEDPEEMIAEKEKELGNLRETSVLEIQQKNQSLRSSIMSEIYDTIEQLAAREGYTAVLDGNIVFCTGDAVTDITAEVIEILNEKGRKNN